MQWNLTVGGIGIEYSIIRMIGLSGLEMNIQ